MSPQTSWPGVQDRSEQDTKFLAVLLLADPRDDKVRIVRTRGHSYRWILDHNDFCRWRKGGQSRLLWIKGDPGEAKTMLLCSIVDELEKMSADSRVLAYFFCRVTEPILKNATVVLRGLLY
ncbi:vegetative incompatibility protein HET-E-1 [Colletotrichum tofieldiae]|nr:vegetative incompatibility protein HET-E-1 [Colletotrichum tofieldiae]